VEVELVVNGRARRVTVTRAESPANVFDVEIDGERWRVDAERIGAHTLSLLLVLWGLVLGSVEVLPRVGYAVPTLQHPAVWSCP
jgi:hypothetical protein